MRLAAYVPMLLHDFPDAAFTSESLHDVARQCMKGFPIYPELAAVLSAWWRAHRPAPPALPPPRFGPQPAPELPPSATAEERALVHERVQEVLAAIRSATASAQPTDEAATFVRASHLSPGVLDQLNPLPNGRKRVPH